MPAEGPRGLDRTGWWRAALLAGQAVLLMLSYAVARPAAESLFLEARGSGALPVAWLAVAGAMAALALLYSRWMARVELFTLYALTALGAAGLVEALLPGRAGGVPLAATALYVWKDCYIVVLVEIFYAIANASYAIRSARWLYGGFGLFGALASMAGGVAVGPLAARLGTAGTLHVVAGLLVVSALAALPGARPGVRRPPAERPRPVLAVLRGSPYLALVLLLVGVVQVVVTLVDFQFNAAVEAHLADTDARTALIGQVYAAISTGTLVLHGLTGPVLRAVGVPAVLLGVPLVLGAGLAAGAAWPGFAAAAALKVASKVFDYTWFRAAKELLYIPLSYDEKTAGKSAVDLLTYRGGKAGASFLILGLQAAGAVAAVGAAAGAFVAVQLGLSLAVARRFRRLVSREAERAG